MARDTYRRPPVTTGELRHRITIQQVTEDRDALGGTSEAWSEFAQAWAAVEPIKGREYFGAQQVNSEVTHRVRLRYREGIRSQMRVQFHGRIFGIEAVLNIDERNRELHLMCVERMGAGG